MFDVWSELSGVSYDTLGFGLAVRGAHLVELINNILSVNHFSKDDVLSVKPGARHEGDEELWAIGVLASISHGEQVWLGMFDLEVLILKLSAVDGLASSAVVVGEISTLGHELIDDAMESWSLVSESLLSSAESSEVLSSLGDDVVKELESDSSGRFIVDADVEEDFGSGGSRHLNIFKKDMLTTLLSYK